MSVHVDENERESWWVRNRTSRTIAIGDLPLLPTINAGKKIDLLKYHSREKISHSKILVALTKKGSVSFQKQTSFKQVQNATRATIDEAVTPAEEDEIDDAINILRDELEDFLNKSVVTEVGDPGSDNNLVTEQGIRESLLDEITEGQEITEDTDGAILYGKDPDSEAAPVGISGEEKNEILTMDLDIKTVLEEIYVELIKANIQMAIITGNEIRNREIHITTQDN